MALARLASLGSAGGNGSDFRPYDAEESEPLKNQLIGSGLSGLGYVGSLFDKLGGRAIRGLIGGKPRELLSVLPFSDTLGITDPESQVTGRDLLKQFGGDPEHDNFAGLKSFVIEAALDPTTYLAPFAKTAKGVAATKAGLATRGLAAGLASGERSLLRASIPFTKIGVDLGTDATRLLAPKISLSRAGKIPRPTFGLQTITGGELASGIDKGVETLSRLPGVTHARAWFDPRVAGAVHPDVQKAAAEVFTPMRNQLLSKARGVEADLRGQLEPLLTPGADQNAIGLAIRSRAEAIPEAAKLVGGEAAIGDALRGQFEDILSADRSLGIPTGKLAGEHGEYATRQIVKAPPGDGGLTSRVIPTANSSLRKRKTPLVDVPGGTEMIESLVHDPSISGFNRPLDVKASRNKILDKLLGKQSAALNDDSVVNIISGVSKRTLGKLAKGLRGTAPTDDPDLLRSVLKGVKPDEIAKSFDLQKLLGRLDRGATPKVLGSATDQAARQAQRVRQRAALEQLLIDKGIDLTAVPPGRTAPLGVKEILRSQPELMSEFRIRAADPGVLADLGRGTTSNQLATALNRLTPKARVTALKKDPRMGGIVRKSGQLAKYLGDLNPRYANEGYAFFNRDPIGDFVTRSRRAATSQSAAETILGLIGKKAVPVSELKRGTESFVRVPKLLRQSGLDPALINERVFNDLGLRLPPTSTNPAADMLRALRNYALPKTLASELTAFNQRHMIPREVGPILSGVDAATALFKRLAYTPFIGSHMRNLGTGIYNNFHAGAFDPTRKGPMKLLGPLKEMIDVELGRGLKATDLPGIAGATPIERAQSLRDRLYQMGVAYRPEMYNELFGKGAPVVAGNRIFPLRPGVDAPLPSARTLAAWNPFSEKFLPVAFGQRFGGKIENALRGSMAISGMRQGLGDDVIKALADKYHFDYGSITEVERQGLKRLIPFYTYSSRNLPLQFKMLADSPRSVASPIRLINNLRGNRFTPDYLGTGSVVPIGDETPEGFQRYISSFGLPFEDAFDKIKTSNSKTPSLPLTLAAYAGMLTPYLKGPIEQAADYQFHTGRRLSDLKPTRAGSLFGALSEDNAQGFSQFLSNTPITRFASTVDKLIDERKGVIPKLLNLGTGVKVTDVDVNKAKAVEARRALYRLLGHSQAISRFQEFYVKPENMDKLTPQQIQLMRLFNTLKVEAKQAAKERRKDR